MKIWGSGDIPSISGIHDKQKSANKIDRTSGVSSKKDVVSISGQAKDYQAVIRALKDVPDVRADKIKDFTERVESGKYDVNGKDVAEKIIKSVIDYKA